jgi:ABC-2 type transport system ATP-binding protein
MDVILKAEKLRKNFTSNRVLENINLDIFRGEILGLIGPSGSGKTTLLNMLIGFVQPDSGTVSFNKGEFIDIWKNKDMIKRYFGFASQHPSFYEKLTVFENLDYFGSLYSLSEEARLNNIKTLLNLVELTNARDTLARNLSGGMQRRLDIACALIHNPDVLIMDEPTSDLDPVLARHIWELVKKINRKGTTIIVASHDLNELEYFCSRIAIISNKRIMHLGTIHELKHALSKGQEVHIETYPGNYETILKNFKNTLIIKAENRGNSLVIYTNRPDKLLVKLLQTIEKLEENLLDLRISKLSLRDVFKNLTHENKPDNKKEH